MWGPEMASGIGSFLQPQGLEKSHRLLQVLEKVWKLRRKIED
jgi:hypothetical protein